MKKRRIAHAKREYKKLCDEIYFCKNCPLSETRIYAVSGCGNVEADLMFVGEAPGADEDLQGKPFVGKSGKRLNAILKSVGTDRDDVFITNVVKCRPPRNRLPSDTEIGRCCFWLNEEIRIVNPTVIIPLGATSTKAIFNYYGMEYTAISGLRGRRFKIGDTTLFPTFHLSYVLRNREFASMIMGDIRKAVKYVM